MASKRKRIFNLLIFLFLMIGVFTYIFAKQDFASIWQTIKSVKVSYLFLGALTMLLFIAGEAIATGTCLTSLGNKVSAGQCLTYSFIGFYFSAVTPSASGGQPAQIYYMNRDKVPISHGTLSLLLHLMIYQFIIVIVAVLLFLFNIAFVTANIKNIKILFIIGIIVNAFLISFLILVFISSTAAKRFLNACVRLLARLRIIKNTEAAYEKIEEQINLYQSGSKYLRTHPIVLFKVVGACLLQILAMATVPYFVYRAFGLNTYSLYNIITIQVILNLSISYLPLPGAMGAAEGGFVLLFGLMFGTNDVYSAMLLYRLISFYMYFAISGIIVLVKSAVGPKKVGIKSAKYTQLDKTNAKH